MRSALVILNQRLELLCEKLGSGEVQQIAAELGVTPPLERVLGAVRDDRSWVEAAVSADLDELDAAFKRWGLDGGLTGRFRSFRDLPGTGGHPVVDVWMCPAGRCSRVVPAARDDPAPVCAVTQASCTLRRLPA
jgi:hypothetical protein